MKTIQVTDEVIMALDTFNINYVDVESKNPIKKWNPPTGKYFINVSGNILLCNVSSNSISEYGCEFSMEEQAQEASIAYRRYHRIYRLALELNGDYVHKKLHDVNNKHISRWFISNCDDSGELMAFFWTNKNINGLDVFFAKKELAQKAIDMLGDEL